MDNKICPYPGLRPFNDDEAIFFKGRDENIEEIVHQLEERKFLMLTGASGDGKSSLVYAGIVPHAKAGLFKAKYNNWAIADFKPEREPLDNLAIALNQYFSFANIDDLKLELSDGYSSLVDLYKKSSLYLKQDSAMYLEADDKQKRDYKRKAKNLIIIADQFEEFFTNPENYNNGITSLDSQIVVNLLLETSKIALGEGLPIYVVCTMRSDYIGQCAAFRGLPEYIGYSQFFVPRLKRKELLQVIEEPAQLNGDRISRRLTERLLNDLNEGYDQLPILQHALNQIWKVAKKGVEELDLIHYAKVGGMASSKLPPDVKEDFNLWFNQLPEYKKHLIEKPSLENILDTHANELSEIAYNTYLTTHPNSSLSREDSKQIIKTSFSCLTKIDASRAVRNRMTLGEIKNIVNNEKVNTDDIEGVLNIFREQGNTFIKPFIYEAEKNRHLSPDTVLDITHESLIRNWSLLGDWAKTEYDNWLIFQDFQKQLERWIQNKKSSGFLLPIGSLTFFQNWVKEFNPNKYWLTKYDVSEDSYQQKVERGEQILSEANDFLKKSSRRLFFSITVMKYGANRIASVFGIFLMMLICTYYYFDFKKKQNDNVVAELIDKGFKYLPNKNINKSEKAEFLINIYRTDENLFNQEVNKLNDSLKFDLLFNVFYKTQNYNDFYVKEKNPLAKKVLEKIKKELKNTPLKDQSANDTYLKALVDLTRMEYYINKQTLANNTYSNLLELENAVELAITSKKKINIKIFDEALIVISNLENDKKRIKKLINLVSPFEKQGKENFNFYFPKDQQIAVGWNGAHSYNGGYQVLAYLYATTSNIEYLKRSFDTIFISTSNYKAFDKEGYLPVFNVYATHCANATDFNNLSDYLALKLEQNKYRLLNRLLLTMYDRIDDWNIKDEAKALNQDNFYFNIFNNIYSKSKLNNLLSSIDRTLNEIKNKDEQNFQKALFNKNYGIINYCVLNDSANSNLYFKKSLSYLKEVSTNYLNETYYVGDPNIPETQKTKRFILVLYPSIINEDNWWDPFMFREIENFTFLNFLANHVESFKGLLNDDFNKFLNIYTTKYLNPYNTPIKNVSLNKIGNVKKLLSGSNSESILNINLLFSLLRKYNGLEQKKDTSIDINYALLNKDIELSYQDGGYIYSNLLYAVCNGYSKQGNTDSLFAIVKKINTDKFKKSILIDGLINIEETERFDKTFNLLDSLFVYIDKTNKFNLKLLYALGKIGGKKIENTAFNMIKELNDKGKPMAIEVFISGINKNGNYYKSKNYIPSSYSKSSELGLINQIIYSNYIARRFEQKTTRNEIIDLLQEIGWANRVELDKYHLKSWLLEEQSGDFYISSE